jgi:rRNA pseudouridine-1189 N-methylase Emg1 (Nep1/Mra1 family)
MSSKATTTKKKKKKTIQVDTKREGERMEKKRKKGRKKGENNLTYLTLLELQDIRSPQ